jgi:hypothetical protein
MKQTTTTNLPFQSGGVKRLTESEMYRIIAERVPMEERVRFTYIPQILIDVCFQLLGSALDALSYARIEKTKAISRELREAIAQHERDSINVMKADLYRKVHRDATEFLSSIEKDIMIHQFQYDELLLKNRIPLTKEEAHVARITYTARDIAGYVITFDREVARKIDSYLGEGVKYSPEDCIYCTKVVEALDKLLKVLGAPLKMESKNITLSYNIFKNKVNGITLFDF